MTDNSVQDSRIVSNDVSNVATAAAALTTHLNNLTCNNSINNITNTNIQAATAAANAAVAAATQSGIALASASGNFRFSLVDTIIYWSLIGWHRSVRSRTEQLQQPQDQVPWETRELDQVVEQQQNCGEKETFWWVQQWSGDDSQTYQR